MSHRYSPGMYLLQIDWLIFSVFSANTHISYIVGLAYYQLGDQHINVDMSATIPNNTALIITLYKAYQPNATINIAGPGRENIKKIIWATYQYPLYFSSDFVHKQVRYAGYTKFAVNKVAQNEFGKTANVIYSLYTSPVDISAFYYGKYQFTKKETIIAFNKLQTDRISYDKHVV